MDVNGHTVTVTPAPSTNYAAPAAVTMISLSESFGWNAALLPLSVTGPNGDSSSTTYDSYGRPQTSASPHGAVTSYSYTLNPPTVTAWINGRFTKTTMDGLGRTIKGEAGDGSGTKSIVDTEYDSCACSPIGKLKRVSQPYAPGGTVYWTTYSYDCLGRTLSVSLPGGTGTTSYLYQGNTTTVTDPAGKWKKFTTDALGNLIQVTEPNPQGGANHETYYAYNLVNKLTQVSMPRAGYTQTRSFVYNNEQRLASATNPENGTVTYSYNGDGSLARKTDAKGQWIDYIYDGYQRLKEVHRYRYDGGEDQGITYYYDYNTFDANYSESAAGRLVATQWGNAYGQGGLFTEMYSYSPGGRVTKKRLRLNRASNDADLNAFFGYDNEGRMTWFKFPEPSSTYRYPDGREIQVNPEHATTYHYAYDTLGRPNQLSVDTFEYGSPQELLVSGVLYGPAGELTQVTLPSGQQTRLYNSRLQLTRMAGAGVDMEYRYSPTQNNGQTSQSKDYVTGEEVTYTYDSLSRLISAVTTGPEWGISLSYDGFGNRTSQTVTKGSAPVANFTYNPATNRVVGSDYAYDANGNVTATAASTLSYDVENRLVGANQEHYGYGPGNQRVWKQWPDGHEEVYFWGPDGRKLGGYRPTESWTGNQQDPHIFVFQTVQNYLYFAGQLVGESAAPQCTEREEGECIHWVLSPVSGIALDRLGSVRARTRPWMQPPYNLLRSSYYPYGEERQTTEQDRDKFATYHRDSTTGLDYASQRYYSSLTGRFLTPDPYQASGGPATPQSWNRYAYVHGDPVNFYDPAGLMALCPPGTHTGPDAMGCVSDNPSTGEGGVSGLGGGSDGMEVVSGGGLDGGGGDTGASGPATRPAYSQLVWTISNRPAVGKSSRRRWISASSAKKPKTSSTTTSELPP